MEAVMKVQSIHGHKELTWDPEKDDARLKRAKELFEQKSRAGYFAYTHDGGVTRILKKFDEQVKEILMAVPLAGG